MPGNKDRCAIAIMAKAPMPGRSKTRLCPPLRPDDAARLSAAFIRDMTGALARAGARGRVDGFLAYAPAGTETALACLAAPGTRLMLADGASVSDVGVAGFGRCLLETVRKLFEDGYGSACVLNSDSPTLPASVLLQAAETLEHRDAVFGPASDGGYYLLGMRAPHAALFTDIAWSTPAVADQTRRQAVLAGLDMVELKPWYDVDDAEGLDLLITDLARPEVAARAPATQAALALLHRDQFA